MREKGVPVELADRASGSTGAGGKWLNSNPPRGEFAGGASEAANVSIVYLLSFNGVRAMFTGDVKATVGRRIAAELKAIADISVARRPE